MRDLILIAILPYLIFMGFRNPLIALGLWLWASTFNINQFVYGIAASIAYSKLFAALTIITFAFSNKKLKIKIESITILIILFFLVGTISNVFAIGNEEIAWQRWVLYFKICLFYLFAIAIINKKIHFDFIIWILVLSIGSMAAKEGLFFIVTFGGHRFDSVIGVVGDNNFFGVMIVVLIPLTYYIISQTENKLIKVGLSVLMFLMVMAVFASYSRGAFLGLIIIAFFFWIKSEKKLFWLILTLLIIFSLSSMLPDEWMSRMNTIEEADSDSSFMGRVIAWKIATLIAMDNFWGGGFNALEDLNVWLSYSQEFYKLDFIPTAEPNEKYAVASHSIYFQVLGNHGFIGLFLFLSILLTAYLKLANIAKIAINNNLDNWIVKLSYMLKISLISYSLSGAAVNVAYFDFLYALFAIIVALESIVFGRIEIDKQKAVTST